MNNEIKTRILKLKESMKSRNIDAIFLYSAENRYYFTGLKTSNGLLLLTADDAPIFFTDFRYFEVAKKQLSPMNFDVRLFKKNDEQLAFYSKNSVNWKTAGYENNLTVSQFLPLRDALNKSKMVSCTDLTTEIRAIKSPVEIDAIRRSAAENDRLFENLMKKIHPGMSEREMVREFRILLAERNLTDSFDPIFCAGVNSVECHHLPDSTILQNNSELLIDMGVKVDDYCSDMTRTVFFGKRTERFNEIHSIVLEANQAVIAAVKTGVSCSEMDRLSRDIITKYGYGEYFGHSLGHSVGLEIHEMPSFSPTCKTITQPGMIITVEPGIYIPGEVGVRIEDLVCITENGCEVLSHTPHEITFE